MNIHLIKTEGMVEVWEMLADCDTVMEDHGHDEAMSEWIEKNSIRKLDFRESWWGMHNANDEEYEENYAEYLLSEKQSALFLLRFK